MPLEKKPVGSDDDSWADFDPEAYFQQYYGEPHPDDDNVVRHACAALKAAQPAGRGLRTIDVGTGPNLIPLFCAMPRAAHMTAWEYAASNVEWLRAELSADRFRPEWQHFWKVAVDAYGPNYDLPDNPLPTLRQKTSVQRGSVFELPEQQWDAATMFFCAESITRERSQFEAACMRFAKCVRPGGALVAAFLAGSSGYTVSETTFPALQLSETDIREVFAALSTDQHTESIGLVEREIRSGYSGMVFLSARAV